MQTIHRYAQTNANSILRIPFYSWFRLIFLLYLILPQTQGAKVLYQTHVDPYLHDNEVVIDEFISSAHDRAKAAGVGYLKIAIEWIKQQVLGFPPKDPTPPSTPAPYYSYTQSLIARFNIPSARAAVPSTGTGNTASDFYSLLTSAVNAATSGAGISSSSSTARDLSNSGALIPPTVHGEDRLSFIAAQRERLNILLSALDKEADNLQESRGKARHVPSMQFDGSSEDDQNDRPKSAASGLSSRKSEGDFEKIESDEVETSKRRTASSGSWLPWSWGAHDQPATGNDTPMGGTSRGEDIGRSSGLDY